MGKLSLGKTSEIPRAKFDCKSGKLEKFPAKINNLKSYKVTVESNDLFIEA